MSRINFTLTTQALAQLFRVRGLHMYYGDRVCRDLEFKPSPACENELRNDRLTFKPLPGGFIVFYHKSQSTPLLKSPAFRPKKLTFLIHNSNKEFWNFSDLPYLPQGSLYYFSNLDSSTVGKKADEKKLLHPNEFAQGNPESILVSMPQAFDFEFDQEVKYTDIQIKDDMGQVVDLPEMDEEAAKNPQSKHRIDLKDHPEGRYHLSIKGKKGISFDFYAGGPAFEECIGILEIYMTDQVEKAFQIADNKGIYPQEYHLQINARSTYWRYNFVNKSEAAYSAHSIESREHKVKFSKPENITLLSGLPATRLTSQEALPLRQYAEHKFELNMKKNGRGIRTPIRLPVPSTKMIQPDLKDQSKVYSEMFIYL